MAGEPSLSQGRWGQGSFSLALALVFPEPTRRRIDSSVKVRAHVLVTGRVQGVFFRSYTQREANRRNVTGWVRNLQDGRVETVLEGEEEDVKGVIEFCARGPSYARVKRVDVAWEDYTGEFQGFRILYRY